VIFSFHKKSTTHLQFIFIDTKFLSHVLLILLSLFFTLNSAISHAYASPSVTTFGWYPSVVETNKPTSFRWDVKNVQSCTSLVSGAKSPSGTIGPVQWSEPRERATKWYCTDLDGNRYPETGYLEAKLSVAHPKPSRKKFYWSSLKYPTGSSRTSHTAKTGENIYFHWDIDNVSSCHSSVSGDHPASGTLGPYNFSEPRTGTTRWTCTDLNGHRYPTRGYLTAKHRIVYPSPSKRKFEWSPSTVEVGKPTYFDWRIDNVKSCTSTHSGIKAARGRMGPMVFYGQSSASLTKWYCTDLYGNRYPKTGYLEATRSVTNNSNLEHINISYTGSGEGYITTVSDNIIARAESVNGTVISTVEFSIDDAVTWLQAYKENGETSYKVSLGQLSEGAYTLRVRINGITQHGLIEIINVVPEPIKLLPKLVRFGWDAAMGEIKTETTIEVGEPTTFYWQIDNVAGCTSNHSGLQDSAGSKGPLTYYGIGTTSLTQWYCTDLDGKRFPEDDNNFFKATLIVENPSNLQHIGVSFKNDNGTKKITTTNKLIATAISINDTEILTAVFRVVAAGEIITEVAAEQNTTTGAFTSHFPNAFEQGGYVLQVAINGVYQGGLDTYFTVASNILSIDTQLLGAPVSNGNLN